MKRSYSGTVLDYATAARKPMSPLEYAQFTEYPCFTALPKDDETSIEFRIDKTDAFIDLRRSFVEVEIQIINKDGSDLKTIMDGTKVKKKYNVAPINNIACALWSDVQLFIQNTRVTATDSFYPWWTYIEQLLNTSENHKKFKLAAESCWRQDTPGAFDDYKLGEEGTNQGHKDRYAIFNGSAKVKVFVPMLLNKQVDQLLPPQTAVSLVFNRSPTNLCLLGENTTEYKIKIWTANLFVERIKMTDAALRHYDRLLNTKGFSYPVRSLYVKNRNVSLGDQNVEWTPFDGRLPQKIYIWQITHEAYNADVTKNPYNFQTFQINKLNIIKNGVTLPISGGFYRILDDGYREMYKMTSEAINSENFTFSLDDYNFGNLVIVADLTKDTQAQDPTGTGTLRISVDYGKPLTGSITIFCMGEYSETLRIGRNKEIELND